MREKKYFIALILLAAVVLLSLPPMAEWRVKAFSRDNLVPFQSVMSSFSIKWQSFVAFVKNPGAPSEERRKLIEENGILRDRVKSLEGLEQDNRELRKQLGFANASRHKMILCEVIARDELSGWWQLVTINKGLLDGVEDGRAVITTEGVIGKTVQVSRETCDVLLVNDPNCRLACKMTRTGAFGIVRGAGTSVRKGDVMEMLCAPLPARIDYVSTADELWAHDEIVTSGLGGVFPEGLLVGYVSKTDMDPSGLYQHADVIPAADLTRLRYVFVVSQ